MAQRQDMRQAELLLQWFYKNKRKMPWRKTKNPYCIWISEVMLQQTQVITVIPYYLKFIERFPTVTDLANATLEEVHAYWQGLGYYRRGENLLKGAKLIEEKWQGVFPKDPKLIAQIPGIGPYTLGAVCSIAYGMKLPAVDGNVMRVIARWYKLTEDIGIAKNRKIFEQKVMAHMPEDAGGFNQALMELGALICTPKNPACIDCPVKQLCQAYKEGVQTQYPVKNKRTKKEEENYIVLVIEKGNRIAMVQRPKQGLLANLWGFPMIQKEEMKRIELDKGIKLPTVTHIFTHKKWNMEPIILKWTQPLEQALNNAGMIEQMLYLEVNEGIQEFAIATAFTKIIKLYKAYKKSVIREEKAL